MNREATLNAELARALLESAPDGVLLVDPGGRIVAVNPRLTELFGYEADELVGASIERLVPERFRGLHADHRARFRTDPAIRTMGVGRTLRGRRKDGSELTVEVGLSPMPTDGQPQVMAIVRDVSEQAELRAQVDLVQQTIDAVHDGVFIFDAESLRFGYVNDGAIRQVGYGRDELLTMTPLDIKPLFSEASFRAMVEPLVAGSTSSVVFETVHRSKAGKDTPVEIILEYPEHANPELPRRLVAIVRDISERKEAERRRSIAEEARERFERQAHLISRLRLRLLGAQPLSEILRSLCDDVRRSELASDAVIFERDRAAEMVAVWGGTTDVGPVDVSHDHVADRLFGVSLERAPLVITVDEAETELERELLRELDAATMVIGPIGQRAIGLVCVRGDEGPLHDIEVLRRLVVEVGEALELADARADRQRLRLLADRERIATDLHDVVIQRLFAAGMRLQAVLPLLEEPARERMQAVVGELDTTISEIRDTIFAIQAGGASGPGLADRIQRTVVANNDYLGFAPELVIVGDVEGLPDPVAAQVIPALTEMLSNVARHARAAAVDITIERGDGRFAMSVVDDGTGIAADAPTGNGLANLRRRADDLGGFFTIEPAPGGRGTAACWSAPVGGT